MSYLEILLVVLLSLIVATPIVVAFVRRDLTGFWSPLTMCSALYGFYFLIGPLVGIAADNNVAVLADAREVYRLGWTAGIVGFVSTALGFAIRFGRSNDGTAALAPPARHVLIAIARFSLAVGLFGVGVSMFGFSAGFEGGLGNYIFSLNNFLAIFFCLMFWLHRGRGVFSVGWVSVPLGLLLLLLLSVGFRGPIVMTSVSVISFWYLVRHSRPSFTFCVLAAVGVVAFAGVMVVTRSYFSGLDFGRLQGLSFREVLLQGLGDSVTFGALCLVIEKVPSIYPFEYGEMFWVAATFPIPRALWPDKPIADYIFTIQKCVGGGNLDQGMAVPHVGEYYLAFGWAGIAIGSFVLGLICRAMWNWYRRSPDNPLVIATYGSFFAWLFQVIHRGYLPTAVSSFCFSVLPGIVFAHWFSRRVVRRRDPPIAPGSPTPAAGSPS